ncbi:polysaccharide pyruvyl transferase family protein [Paenibacillus sp. GSMTC-2017]|uniref:polysaccharide pyruvyl transferase family protein n=1 Tax=Paenibacillus sp. GSMTC-2017 TaxID=2794350 RepID=UPI0018D9F6FC|nr:polysaccharide pyruvyl transferase family protein [Paenibacillus sp. GSMTC-2017]MBH5317297.1 polysaccharide pyruvyl transferase family protein [Paenibacillus sp. GSMTC-2017]
MKIMMFAHGGSLNRGCEAIVRSSTNLIKDQINGSEVYLASHKPETDKLLTRLDGIYDGSAVGIRKFSKEWLVATIQNKLFRSERYALGVIEKNTIRHIKDMDIVMSIGGDNYCYGEQPNWYEIDRRVKQQGKKLVLWGCSIGEEDMSDEKLEDLKRFDLIIARETLTYNMLISKGLKKVKLSADPAFTMEQEELSLPEGWQEGNTVGINFSPLVSKLNEKSREAVNQLIKHILKETTMTIALTPHVIYEGNNDYVVLQQIYEQFKSTNRVILLPDHLSAIQYKGYIARMRFFIGARTHATIAAYSNYVPTMVLGYSVKSKGIAKDIFGEEKLVLDLKQLSHANILKDSFDEMVREEEVIKAKLKESMPKIKKMSHKAVDYLKELA